MPLPAGASAAEYSLRRFGYQTRLVVTHPSVDVTATAVLGDNPRRVAWLAINRSVNNGALDYGRDVAFASGVLLGAGGGFASMTVEEDGEAVTYGMWGINDGAAGTWIVLEVETA